MDHSHKYSLADLRTLQDWHLRYQLETVPGVAEVARPLKTGRAQNCNSPSRAANGEDGDYQAAHGDQPERGPKVVHGGAGREEEGQ